MKPPIPVGSCKAAAHGTLGPTSWVNVFYFDVDGTGHTPGAVISQIATNIHELYHTALGLGMFPTNWKFTSTTVSYRDAADSLVRVRVADAANGAGDGASQDAQVSYLLNWATGDPRRGGKPRQYLSGVRDNVMADPAFLDTSFTGPINTRLITWLTSLPGLPVSSQLVEMSFRNGNTWRTDAHSYPIIGGNLNPVVATQRRRIDRVRPA